MIRYMCLLIETIKIYNGRAENIFWHNWRFNSTRMELFGIQKKTDLGRTIFVPDEFSKGEVKCRIIYSENIHSIEFIHYQFRKVNTLKIVESDDLEYNYKFKDRSGIDRLFLQREDNDDILISKNGSILETSYCNVVFFDGANYFTPSHPLLRGTKREKYLSEFKIKEREIKVDEIANFREVHLINAFLDLDRCVVSTKNIRL